MTPALFTPFRVRDVMLRNRVGVSPMCQYSSADGMANDWHLVHLGAFAKGGAGLVIVEATAVVPEGRISPGDLGLWHEEQVQPLRRIASFIESQGAVPGIQLAHAGRKASTPPPWAQPRTPLTRDEGGWPVVAPSAIPFDERSPVPRELSPSEVAQLPALFADAARRAVRAGFKVIEIHAAHGYLLHEFLSPLSNHRKDAYGGTRGRRSRVLADVCRAVRSAIGDERGLFVRVSATDWVAGGWTGDDTVELARALRSSGVDVLDCSTGGNTPHAVIPTATGYQVEFAERVRREAGLPTAAVGLIVEPEHAERVIGEGRADLVLLGRAMLRNPSWANDAAMALGAPTDVPLQYGWALGVAS